MAFHRDDSQHKLVLEHMKHRGGIHPEMAHELYGIFRLGAIIFNIKKEGHKVDTKMVYYTKPSGRRGRYAVYSLAENK